MGAEAVGFMARAVEGGRAAGSELVTRDFLGGCGGVDDAKGKDAGRHDVVVHPRKLSLQKHACPPAPRDLSLFPVTAGVATSTQTSPTAAAATAAAAAAAAAPTSYHSVCTIEKVKTALERFERGKLHQQHQHGGGAGRLSEASPSSSSITTSSIKRRGEDAAVEQGDGCDSPGAGGGMMAAACPKCFLYVLISKEDPRCPRCESRVPAPILSKKPRIDLNVDFLGT